MCHYRRLNPAPFAAQTSLKHTQELVCLAMEPGCTAVGSQSYVTLLDPRKKGPAQYIQNIQGNCVRASRTCLPAMSSLLPTQLQQAPASMAGFARCCPGCRFGLVLFKGPLTSVLSA